MKPLTVLITGGSTRIGKALSGYFASKGFEVIIHYNKSENDAELLSKDLQQKFGDRRFPVVKCDLNRVSECEIIFENISHLDVLINNASVFEPGLLSDTNFELFRKQMSVNFESPFFLMKSFYNRYKRGTIINLLDTRIVNNNSSHGAYSLAKKALGNLTQMAALEWAPYIRVNGVAPGPVLPPCNPAGEYFEKVIDATPLKKQVSIDNLCETVYFLAVNSDVTGQIIYCDGGSHIK